MKYYKIRIPIKEPQIQYVSIIPIGDIHFGSPFSNEKRAFEFREFILSQPNCYTINMGDDMNNVTRMSVGNIYEQRYGPYYQHQQALRFWRPLAQAKKVLCAMDDNHSKRSMDETDTHWVEEFCRKLKVRHGGFGAFLDLRMGKQQYTINVTHGTGGGTTAAGVLNSLIKMSTRCVADIYLRAHHHRKMIHQDEIKRLTKHGLQKHKRTFGITGSFLEWDDSYAEAKEYSLSVVGCIKLKLFLHKWDSHISL